MTLTKEWLLTTIAELEEERDAVPGAVNEDAAKALAAMKLALASLEAEAMTQVLSSRAGNDTSTIDKALPEGTMLFTAPPAPVAMKDHQIRDLVNELRDIAVEYYGTQQLRERIAKTVRAAMLQGADEKPEITVWYGSMPESNGKANWTAILHRKGEGPCMDGFTIDRSEYPGRVLYAADRVRYLIGEKSERPSILDYDADAHSGYVKPGNSPVVPDGWVACSERMPSAGEQVLAYRPDAPESNDPLIKMATYVGGSAHGHGFDCYCKPTHWMPLPAAPEQED